MKYILESSCELCGYKNVPFVLYDGRSGASYIMGKEEFLFLFSCNGKNEIEMDNESEKVQKLVTELMQKGLLQKAENGETRTLIYNEFPGVFKDVVHWVITGKCNYRCRHCFQSAPEGILGEPSKEQIFDLIRQFRQNGIRSVGLTGGEPLIRKDFFEILDELNRNNIKVITIFSNGAMITEDWLDQFEERNIHPNFQISFDGIGFHDWTRGVPGAELRTRNAIRLLAERGYDTKAAMFLCKENIGSIRETVNILAEDGCKELKFQMAVTQGEWCNQKEHYLSVAETMQAYLDYLPQYVEDGSHMGIQLVGILAWNEDGYGAMCDRKLDEKKVGIFSPSGVVSRVLHVGPNGAVTPCMNMCGAEIESQFPNVFDVSLKEILTESSYTEITEKGIAYILEHVDECRECEYRYRCCGGSRVWAVGQNGSDYFAKDPVTCELFKEGWVDKFYRRAAEVFGEEKLMKQP